MPAYFANRRGMRSGGGGGGGVQETFTTLDPADKSTGVTLSNGDLTMSTAAGGWKSARSVATFAGGKHHLEIRIDTNIVISNLLAGFIRTSSVNNDTFPGSDASGLGYQISNSIFYNNGGQHAAGADIGAWAVGDWMIMEIDDDAGTFYITRNTGSYTSCSYPAGITAGASQTKKVMIGLNDATMDATANFGSSAWVKTPTSGFAGLAA
jgi:hypothetical protein